MPNKEWHPLFVTSLREALSDARPGEVEIQAEVALSSKPLDIDVLVVKKSDAAALRHPIADIFKTYNLFEFKSPEDYLEPNDFDKGMAIALLYKVIEHGKMLALENFTVTFVSRRHPRSMLDMLRKRGLVVLENKPSAGLYRVEGGVMPVQVLVLRELQSAEESYMFAAFFTGNEKLRVAATKLLLTKYIDDPSNPYRRELLEFKFRNRLFNVEEMEEVLKMSSQMTERDRVQMEEFLRNHPVIQKMNERIRVESEARGEAKGEARGEAKGEARGEIKAKQDAIFKFLARRFGAEIAGLQQKVRQITSIEVLDRIMEELFAANTLEESRIIISGDPDKSIQ